MQPNPMIEPQRSLVRRFGQLYCFENMGNETGAVASGNGIKAGGFLGYGATEVEFSVKSES